MKYWINALNFSEYCEGDKSYGDYWIEVPQRFSSQHTWDGHQWSKTIPDPVREATLKDVIAALGVANIPVIVKPREEAQDVTDSISR